MADPRHGPATPHRQRQNPPPPFTFAPPPRPPEWPSTESRMGNESPRSKVAHHFGALNFDGAADATWTGGGGALPSPRQPPRADAPCPAEASRPSNSEIRQICPEQSGRGDPDAVMEDAQLTIRERGMAAQNTAADTPLSPEATNEAAQDTDSTPAAPAKPKRAMKKRKAPTAATKRTTRTKKTTRKTKPPPPDPDSSDREIVDPVRASLTWQEDEITVYDPEDADDDGEGMDGVGFQPPPGAARVTARRKLGQLAEYRRMVEREAREGRRRRRGGRGAEERVSRVRFMEGETVIAVL